LTRFSHRLPQSSLGPISFLAVLLFVASSLLTSCRVSRTSSATPLDLPPNTAPPWPDITYYFDAKDAINVRVDEEFAVGFWTLTRLGLIWEETHDESLIALEQKTYTFTDSKGITWFRYQALKQGATEIRLRYSHGGTVPPNDIREERVLRVSISE
jgi:hypothetical protein